MRFLARFECGPYNRLKNPSVAMNAPRSATRILLRGRGIEPKENFFPRKLSNLGPLLSKLMQLKHVTEGVWGQSPQPLGDFRDFAGKNNNFNAISITFCTFLKSYKQ